MTESRLVAGMEVGLNWEGVNLLEWKKCPTSWLWARLYRGTQLLEHKLYTWSVCILLDVTYTSMKVIFLKRYPFWETGLPVCKYKWNMYVYTRSRNAPQIPPPRSPSLCRCISLHGVLLEVVSGFGLVVCSCILPEEFKFIMGALGSWQSFERVMR